MQITVNISDALVDEIEFAANDILGRNITVTELEKLIAGDLAVRYEQDYLSEYRHGDYNIDYDYIRSMLDDIVEGR